MNKKFKELGLDLSKTVAVEAVPIILNYINNKYNIKEIESKNEDNL
ncbi:hypothetical protein [Clostridium sp. C2-6-12]|nr:hypothetical protein [Clostridium sp. C2-6-12]